MVNDLIFNQSLLTDTKMIAFKNANLTKLRTLVTKIINDESLLGVSKEQDKLIYYLAAQYYNAIIPALSKARDSSWTREDWVTDEEHTTILINLNKIGIKCVDATSTAYEKYSPIR